jgi:hypothetical protein
MLDRYSLDRTGEASDHVRRGRYLETVNIPGPPP